MSEKYTPPTLEELAAYPWEAIAAQVEVPICQEIAHPLLRRGLELDEAGDKTGANVFRFIGQIALLHLDPSDREAPFSAATSWQTKRLLTIQDYGSPTLDIVDALSDLTKIPALRARFCDILWIVRRDRKEGTPAYKSGIQAANDYLATFKMLEASDKWAWEFDALRRGMTVAREVVRRNITNSPFVDYVRFIESRLRALETTCEDAYAWRLLGLLSEHKVGDLKESARIAESIGDRFDALGSSSFAQGCYDQAMQFCYFIDLPTEAERVGRKKGESLMVQAESCIGKPSQGHFMAARYLATGITCLRQFGGDEVRITELHKKLLSWGAKINSELKSSYHEFDFTLLADHAVKKMEGKSLQDAIFAMALFHPGIRVAELRQRVSKVIEKHPLATIFGATFIDEEGRFRAHKPSSFTIGKDPEEQFLEPEMFHSATECEWLVRAKGYIEICRREIWLTHHPRVEDLHFLVLQNPFIPPGQELLFLKGIVAGFRAEFDVAAHLLIPHIEGLIRHVLRSAGHITSGIKPEIIQDMHLLRRLLELPETRDIFGVDHVFELRGLLIEEFGFNLRNRLAHGSINYEACWGIDVVNSWWLVIRLLCFPVARSFETASPLASDSQTDKA